MGATPEQLQEVEQAALEPDDFEVWPENIDAVAMFVTLGSQWRVLTSVAGGVHWQGLRYEAVEATMRMTRVPLTKRQGLLYQLRTMESEARSILNDRARS